MSNATPQPTSTVSPIVVFQAYPVRGEVPDVVVFDHRRVNFSFSRTESLFHPNVEMHGVVHICAKQVVALKENP